LGIDDRRKRAREHPVVIHHENAELGHLAEVSDAAPNATTGACGTASPRRRMRLD
jgi:hypothetical protein